jgi:hypothetical protein
MSRIVLVLFVVVLAVAAWRFQVPLSDAIDRLRGGGFDTAGEATPALADAAEQKLACLGEGTCEEVALSALELQSLLQFRYAQLLPAFIDSARIDLSDDRLRLRGRIPAERLPVVRGLDPSAILPDTAELSVQGHLEPLQPGRVGFVIDQVNAARVPLPGGMVPPLLRSVGRADEPGLPENGIGLTLPYGATGAYLRGDSIFLRGRTAQAN